jgi:hypothetical protein
VSTSTRREEGRGSEAAEAEEDACSVEQEEASRPALPCRESTRKRECLWIERESGGFGELVPEGVPYASDKWVRLQDEPVRAWSMLRVGESAVSAERDA